MNSGRGPRFERDVRWRCSAGSVKCLPPDVHRPASGCLSALGLDPNFVNFLSQVEWRPRRAKFRERCVAAHTSGPRKTACLLKIPVERCSWPTPNIYFDRITHLSRMHAARAPASRFLGDDACDEQMLPCLAHSARRLLLRPVVCRALPPVLAVSVGTAIHSSFASQTLCMWQPPEQDAFSDQAEVTLDVDESEVGTPLQQWECELRMSSPEEWYQYRMNGWGW